MGIPGGLTKILAWARSLGSDKTSGDVGLGDLGLGETTQIPKKPI